MHFNICLAIPDSDDAMGPDIVIVYPVNLKCHHDRNATVRRMERKEAGSAKFVY